jgi:hypothetical protein
VTNCLSNLYPAVARQWHPRKNGELRPRDVYVRSRKTYWWRCRAGPDHEWQATIRQRTVNDHGCPFCAGKRVSVTNCLERLVPEIAREWHPTRNGKLEPTQVMAGERRLVWWRCPTGHGYRATIADRTVKRRGCPKCAAGGAVDLRAGLR